MSRVDLANLGLFTAATSTLFTHEFALTDKVALVTGANRGIGLETAMALAEAGARAVYCVDLSEQPGDDWKAVRDYLTKLDGAGRLEYVHGDVRSQASALLLPWKSECIRNS